MTKYMVVEASSHPVVLEDFQYSGLPRLGRFLHEHEISGRSLLEVQQGFPPYPGRPDGRIGIPSVEKASTDNGKDTCTFTPEWQWFSYELILMRVKEVYPNLDLPGQIDIAKKIFNNGWRNDGFSTNRAGTDTHRSDPNGTNMDQPFMELECVPTGGNLGMVLTEPFNYKNAQVVKVQCFDGTKPPPDPKVVNWHTTPWLIHLATIETRIPTPSGGRVIRQFEFQSVPGFPCFQIVSGREYYLFESARLKRL